MNLPPSSEILEFFKLSKTFQLAYKRNKAMKLNQTDLFTRRPRTEHRKLAATSTESFTISIEFGWWLSAKISGVWPVWSWFSAGLWLVWGLVWVALDEGEGDWFWGVWGQRFRAAFVGLAGLFSAEFGWILGLVAGWFWGISGLFRGRFFSWFLTAS